MPGGCPQLAFFLEVVALLQLSLADVASEERVAVLVHPVGEVLTGDADTAALPALKLPVVNEIPLLQNATRQYISTTTGLSRWASATDADLQAATQKDSVTATKTAQSRCNRLHQLAS